MSRGRDSTLTPVAQDKNIVYLDVRLSIYSRFADS